MTLTAATCPQCETKTDENPCRNCGYDFEDLEDNGFRPGDRIYWHDPDQGIASGPGTVITAGHPEIIEIELDRGSEAEVLAEELEKLETQ